MKKFILFIPIFTCALIIGCGNTKDNSVNESPKTTSINESTESPVTDEANDNVTFDSSESQDNTTESNLEDGTYTADFKTDSSMFHVNEAYNGKGTLTVTNGQMSLHVSLNSKNIVNLYVGMADDAKNDSGNVLKPTTDTVTYSDGTTEEVYGFDIPIEAIDKEFNVAIIGTKNKWYDHKVTVSNPVKK